MKSPILTYGFEIQPKTNLGIVFVRGISIDPVTVFQIPRADAAILEVIISYLNQLSLTIQTWKVLCERLLKASLDRNGLNQAQEEIAKRLQYASLSQFCEDNYGSGRKTEATEATTTDTKVEGKRDGVSRHTELCYEIQKTVKGEEDEYNREIVK